MSDRELFELAQVMGCYYNRDNDFLIMAGGQDWLVKDSHSLPVELAKILESMIPNITAEQIVDYATKWLKADYDQSERKLQYKGFTFLLDENLKFKSGEEAKQALLVLGIVTDGQLIEWACAHGWQIEESEVGKKYLRAPSGSAFPLYDGRLIDTLRTQLLKLIRVCTWAEMTEAEREELLLHPEKVWSKPNPSPPNSTKEPVGRKKKKKHKHQESKSDEKSPRCPLCNTRMVQRTSIHGQFWGCTNYPTCTGTRKIEGPGVQVDGLMQGPAKAKLDLTIKFVSEIGGTQEAREWITIVERMAIALKGKDTQGKDVHST